MTDSWNAAVLNDAIRSGGAGGGSQVVANPEGAATNELEKLGVDGTVYAIPKGVDYSTNEVDTGIKWIDGSTIYKKVIVLEDVAFDSDGTYEINLTTYNVKNCFPDWAHSFYIFSTYVRMFDKITQEADSDFTTNNKLVLEGTATRPITLGYIAIQYTKVTTS